MSCVNLMQWYSKRFKIGWDPAYDPKHRPADKLDPWYMVVLCERGEIYPYGGNLLAAEVDGRPITAKRLRNLECTTVVQDGDDFVAVTFDAVDFDTIAELLKPRRRRQVSESEKQRLQSMGAKHGFKPQKRLPDHSRAP